MANFNKESMKHWQHPLVWV